MTASALKGYPLLEYLDRTGASSLALAVGLSMGGVLVGVLGLLVMGDLPDQSLLAERYSQQELSLVVLSLSTMAGAYLALAITIARSTQRAVEANLGSGAVGLRHHLEPRRQNYFVATAFLFVAIGVLAYVNLVGVGFNTFSISEVLALGPIGVLTQYILQPLGCLAMGIVAAVLLSVSTYLTEVARTQKISLLETDRYSCLATPFIYLFIGASVLLSLMISMAVFMQDETSTRLFLSLIPLIILVSMVIGALLGRPLWVFRNRLVQIKREHRAMIYTRLEDLQPGDGERAHLLTELMFLKQLPDIPIGPYFQRIVVFGVLPPLTWVMAATIENLLYS